MTSCILALVGAGLCLSLAGWVALWEVGGLWLVVPLGAVWLLLLAALASLISTGHVFPRGPRI